MLRRTAMAWAVAWDAVACVPTGGGGSGGADAGPALDAAPIDDAAPTGDAAPIEDAGAPDAAPACAEGAARACGSDVGECAPGVSRCVEGEWTACDDRGPAGEQCNGLDDDCDGEADEGIAGCDGCVPGTVMPCPDVGVCRTGQRRCVDGAFGLCEWAIGPSAEQCNGLDDDCNGVVDDGLVTPTCRDAVGVCTGAPQACRGADGWVCDDGAFGAHDPQYERNETSCDGLDNDCDGEVDEVAPPECPAQDGVCAGATRTCRAAAGLAACDTALYTAHDARYEEVEVSCDGLDNDCDGEVDERLEPPPADRNQGLCAGQVKTCEGRGGWQNPDYAAIEGFQFAETRCDGLDNDCDGVVDPMLSTPEALAACRPRGVCAEARTVCDGRRSGGVGCVQVGAGPEDCNARDDDCDGDVDEDLTAPACPNQQGVCAGTVPACRGAAGWGPCDDARLSMIRLDYEELETTCDGLDNDCDGRTDQGPGMDPPICQNLRGVCADAPMRCAGADGWRCDAGAYAAYTDAYEPDELSCDGADNDCDGDVDEGNDCFCSERATTWCRDLGPEWDVAQDPRDGKLICTRGLDFGRNCSPCEDYRIIVWEDGAPDGTCQGARSTEAGETYGGHDPCQCADNLRTCGPWAMGDCIPD